jgi:PAS domain S-box-containing protein
MSISSAFSGFASEQPDLVEKIVETTPVALVVADVDGRIVNTNRRAKAMFGQHLQSESGFSQIVGRIYRHDGTRCAYEDIPGVRALRGHVVAGEEMLLDLPNGEKVSLVVNADPIRNRTGSIVGAVVVMDDLTPVKEIGRLQQEWTSIIAHDLRQPVSVILGYARQVATRRRARLAEMTTSIEHIRASAYQLSRMINDLIDASRLDVHRLSIQLQAVDIAALVRTVVERLSSVMTERPMYVCIAGGGITPIHVDPNRFEQILGNLLSNAVKHARPGTDIRVGVRRNDREAEVSVTNHGDGIPPEELPRLFTRYHQPVQPKEPEGGGLGLGLYIARGLVEAHGGRIWVESTPGQLTTFYFTIPERDSER